MLAYKITGDTSYESKEIKKEELSNYLFPKWYVSEKSINWTTNMYLDGKITERPIVKEIEQPIEQLTKEELLEQLDWEYQPQFLELIRAWSNATMDNNQYLANKHQISKTILKNEYDLKRKEITNG